MARRDREFTTAAEAKDAIQALIDRFPDADFIECLDEMIDLASSARAARIEETGRDDDA